MIDRRPSAGRISLWLAVGTVVVLAVAIMMGWLARRDIDEATTTPTPAIGEISVEPALPPPAADPVVAAADAEPVPLAVPPQAPRFPPPKQVGPIPEAIDVTVIDSDDHPVANAEVLMRSTISDESAARLEELGKLLKDPHADPAATRKLLDEITKTDDRPAGTTWESPSARYLTDEQGRCRVPLRFGAGEIYASRDGVGTSGVWKPARFEHDPDAPSDPTAFRHAWDSAVILKLLPHATLTGIAVGADGTPLAGALVSVGHSFSNGREVETKPREVEPAETDEN
ncbi:MAG TPA: hypothetical protein VFY71_19105, partial [Planctomycetota bacterium]|nr:hypothetical protein [Planctomycetota bacterium]